MKVKMKKKMKKKYEAPRIVCSLITLENAVAAGSVASINTGWNQYGEDNQPKVNEWESSWISTSQNDFDI